MSVKQRVEKLLAELGDWEPTSLSDDAHVFRDLGFNSLDSISMIMDAEEHFEIEILDEEAESVHTVGDLVRLIESKL
jgi:acyl carrier protein